MTRVVYIILLACRETKPVLRKPYASYVTLVGLASHPRRSTLRRAVSSASCLAVHARTPPSRSRTPGQIEENLTQQDKNVGVADRTEFSISEMCCSVLIVPEREDA